MPFQIYAVVLLNYFFFFCLLKNSLFVATCYYCFLKQTQKKFATDLTARTLIAQHFQVKTEKTVFWGAFNFPFAVSQPVNRQANKDVFSCSKVK